MRPLIACLRDRFPELTKDELVAKILCGEVRADGERMRDPKQRIDPAANISIQDGEARFVSRGGIKLNHALRSWGITVAGKVFVDAGASTGGFTDCLLRGGAARVHAVDVGYNQLDYRLRTDSRVVTHERTNIMSVQELSPRPDAAVIDLSFRSLVGAAAHVLGLLRERWAVALVKPQFEWESPPAAFTGVVPESHLAGILEGVVTRLWGDGAYVQRIIESPITGTEGNREFLVLLSGEEAVALEEMRATVARIVS